MKSSIGKKMTMSFSVILFFVVVALIFVMFTSHNTLTKSKELAQKTFPTMMKMDNLKLSIYDRRIIYDQYFLSKKPQILKNIKKIDAEIQKNMVAIKADKNLKIDAKFSNYFDEYNKKFDKLVVFIKKHPENLSSAMRKVAVADQYFNTKLVPIIDGMLDQKQQQTDKLVGEIQASLKKSQLIFLIIGIIAVVLGFVLSGRLAKMLTTSVKSLTKAADQISMGDFDTKIDVKTGDEIEELANSIDRMKRSLQKAMERLMNR